MFCVCWNREDLQQAYRRHGSGIRQTRQQSYRVPAAHVPQTLTILLLQPPYSQECTVVSSVPKPVITVQVRELIHFVLRTGDLGGEGAFVGAKRALAGTRGHQRVQKARPVGYQKEVRLSFDIVNEEFILRIQGRIDGILATDSDLMLEEIKTVQGAWDGIPDPLHWAQAQFYAHIYCQERTDSEIVIRLAYLELESERLTEFTRRFKREELAAFFEQTTAIYMEWVQERLNWIKRRDQSILSLGFPFAQYRPGQREVAVAAYRAIVREQRLFVEAPTGIGKTISALFPAVKGLAQAGVERIFYLTARTTGQAVVEQAWKDLRKGGLLVRTVILTAKEKLCVNEGTPCDPRLCPLTRGYYDRHKPAIRACLERENINREVLEEVGREHQVCPFELSLDVSEWVDAVTCDYNYAFDPRVSLRRHFAEGGGEHVLLVDEAHNLVDRAREMYSAEISTAEIQEVRQGIKQALPQCAKALGKLASTIRQFAKAAEAVEPPESDREGELNLDGSSTRVPEAGPVATAVTAVSRFSDREAHVEHEFPESLFPVLEKALTESERWLIQNEETEFRPALLELYFRITAFCRVAAQYDHRYRTLILGKGQVRMKLFCLDPSFLLRETLDLGKAAIFFSATLSPTDYYRELLGGSGEDPAVQVPSPFSPDHLAVLMQDRIRTDFKSRMGTLNDVVEAIDVFVHERRGNYLVYLPSYEYLAGLQARFESAYPGIRLLIQRPGMTDSERHTFLAAFTHEPSETQVGFAVMGGVFAEGIDLVGERLIGVAVIGVGLPQLCMERDLIRDYFQEKMGAGFDYAYRFPGMNRVLQAAGRVIRSESDRGAILLVDLRFGEPRYLRLLPRWWQLVRTRTPDRMRDVLRQFWEQTRT